MEGMTKNRWCC